MKKLMLFIMGVALLFVFIVPDDADARRGGRGGGFSSPKQGITSNPSRSADSSQSSSVSSTRNTSGTNTAATSANRGFFSGGSLMKGLMIGGLAGMLFGGMFAGMGGLGEFMGLLVNVLAIYLLFIAIRGIIRYFRDNRDKTHDQRRTY
ncbi:hypothetical protein IDH44_20800 [Paenibacillus sp. IB182496]|uniref:Import inner membrane translocase subunit Tim44 n=1 Tax=Paenibacillus sabuli TaxID=2772509 RepID=A0A927GUF1_9BACL|nr:hypothetical protein [Paenibacillus sabuli]MBD2847637.1 hypothetical protein [Paenibacillus sabuli]